jgi:hypothetical protein
MRTSSACLVLCVALFSASASAQKVVILEFDGDNGHKLRKQVESAVKTAGEVEVVSIVKYKDAAAKKKLKGGEAMTPAAVARLAKELNIDAAVEGAVGSSFAVRILDGAGQELWSKELAIKKGLLSDEFAKKLAKAIAAAAQTTQKEPVAVAPVKPDAPKADAGAPENTTPELDLTLRTPDSAMNPRRPIEEPTDPVVEPHDKDLDDEVNKPVTRRGPSVVRLWLAGSTTWRSYCARPGVTNCAEYDVKPMAERPAGTIVNFTAQAPYLGGQLSGELFPLALLRRPSVFLQGLGITGSVNFGSSATVVRKETAAGPGPETTAQSVELGWSAGLSYRYYYAFGIGPEKSAGYIGLRGDLRNHRFTVDSAGESEVPGTFRLFPSVGLDVSFPLLRYLRLEASGSYFINPAPGPDEIYGYGDATHPTGGGVGAGFSFEGGIAGDIWGPIGYQGRVRMSSYKDRFYGKGNKWLVCDERQCGGAAEETYVIITWGVTAAF